MKVVAIIQARLGSSRLPGKVLADIAGQSMITRVIERTAAASTVSALAVATTTAAEDDRLVDALERVSSCVVFRGSADDVLSRYYECAKALAADAIVRVTADDPLKDPGVIDRAVGILETTGCDYCSNTLTPSYPEGLDIEVFLFSALARAFEEAKLLSEREHVTPYIWKHSEVFRIQSFTAPRNLSDWRWTVDHPKDLEFVRRVFEQFRNSPLVRWEEVVAWLDEHPEVRAVNMGIARNEGYAKSLIQDSL